MLLTRCLNVRVWHTPAGCRPAHGRLLLRVELPLDAGSAAIPSGLARTSGIGLRGKRRQHKSQIGHGLCGNRHIGHKMGQMIEENLVAFWELTVRPHIKVLSIFYPLVSIGEV